MLLLLKSLHRHKNGKMAKALTPYVCMMIFLSPPVKRNVCKSHFYATQTSLSLNSLCMMVDGKRFFGENSCSIEKRFCLRKLSLTTDATILDKNIEIKRPSRRFLTQFFYDLKYIWGTLTNNFVWNCYKNKTSRCEKFKPQNFSFLSFFRLLLFEKPWDETLSLPPINIHFFWLLG